MKESKIEAAERLDEVIATKVRLEAIISSAMDAIITIDTDHCVIFFNPAAEEMFGITSDIALGQPIGNFIPKRFRSGHDEHIRRFGDTGVTGRRMGALGAISALRANGEEFPVEASISQAIVGNERLSTVILRDITERKANEEARALLAREVDHRAKNALAIVQALVSLTKAPTHEAFIAAVNGRVSALARAHSLLAKNRWAGGLLSTVIEDEMAAYDPTGQVRYSGPKLMLIPKAVQPLSLLIHELATNAVKYGALSVETGRVDIDWAVTDGDALELVWRERGGPEVVPPTQKGFGSNLIANVTASQLGGEVDIDWEPSGLVVTARLPGIVMRTRDTSKSGSSDQSAKPQKPEKSPGNRVLLVEDEVLVAAQVSEALQAAGWDILGPVSSIEEAHNLVAGRGWPDAAVLDVNLDGVEVFPLADVLLKREIPVVFCTGYEELKASGKYDDCPRIGKPANTQALDRTLRTMIAQSSPEEAG